MNKAKKISLGLGLIGAGIITLSIPALVTSCGHDGIEIPIDDNTYMLKVATISIYWNIKSKDEFESRSVERINKMKSTFIKTFNLDVTVDDVKFVWDTAYIQGAKLDFVRVSVNGIYFKSQSPFTQIVVPKGSIRIMSYPNEIPPQGLNNKGE